MIWLSLSNMYCIWILMMDSDCISCTMILAFFILWKLNLYCISYYILFIFWYIFHFMNWLSLSNMYCIWILVMDSACILCQMILAYFILWKLDLYCISYYILIIFLVYFPFYELIIIIKYALQKLQLCSLCKDNVYTQVTI